jgi:hypothetical protein
MSPANCYTRVSCMNHQWYLASTILQRCSIQHDSSTSGQHSSFLHRVCPARLVDGLCPIRTPSLSILNDTQLSIASSRTVEYSHRTPIPSTSGEHPMPSAFTTCLWDFLLSTDSITPHLMELPIRSGLIAKYPSCSQSPSTCRVRSRLYCAPLRRRYENNAASTARGLLACYRHAIQHSRTPYKSRCCS